MSTTKAKRLSHRVQYTGEEHVENFRVTVAIEKALKTLERHSAYLVVSRYFRRWILRATLTLRRDSLVAEVCAGRIATAQPPASPTTTTGASGCCSSCGTSSSAINELRALAARLHHRVAQRDRMISYLASQRDAAVRWSDRVVHAAVLTQHQRVDAHASMLGQALSVAPPPPPPPHHPSLGTAHASGNDGSAANVSRHVIDPLMALLAIPVPVEAELRARIASLESRLMALGEDPRRVAWPKRPNPSTADLLKRKVTSSTSVPLALSSVATNEQPEAKVAVASSARRSQSAAPPSTTQNRRSLGGSLDGAGAPTSPLSPSGSGASPADPIVAWMDPSPRTAAAAVDDPQASRESPTPHASDTIDEEEPGDTDEPPSARRSTGPHALVTTPARGLVRRSEATAGLSTLDVEPMSGRSSSNNNNSGTTMVAHSVTSGQRQPTVDPSWPVAPTQYATGRPLRLHRVPAEMLQIVQPAPIHNRGFAPSQARVALTVKRTGVAHPAANATQRSQSGQNRSDAFRVVPQRQPAMGVAPVSASTQAAVATAKKAGSRGS